MKSIAGYIAKQGGTQLWVWLQLPILDGHRQLHLRRTQKILRQGSGPGGGAVGGSDEGEIDFFFSIPLLCILDIFDHVSGNFLEGKIYPKEKDLPQPLINVPQQLIKPQKSQDLCGSG